MYLFFVWNKDYKVYKIVNLKLKPHVKLSLKLFTIIYKHQRKPVLNRDECCSLSFHFVLCAFFLRWRVMYACILFMTILAGPSGVYSSISSLSLLVKNKYIKSQMSAWPDRPPSQMDVWTWMSEIPIHRLNIEHVFLSACRWPTQYLLYTYKVVVNTLWMTNKQVQLSFSHIIMFFHICNWFESPTTQAWFLGSIETIFSGGSSP